MFSVKHFAGSDGQSTKQNHSDACNFSYDKCNGVENFVLKPVHELMNNIKSHCYLPAVFRLVCLFVLGQEVYVTSSDICLLTFRC